MYLDVGNICYAYYIIYRCSYLIIVYNIKGCGVYKILNQLGPLMVGFHMFIEFVLFCLLVTMAAIDLHFLLILVTV